MNRFEVPRELLSASPDDVQGVVDIIIATLAVADIPEPTVTEADEPSSIVKDFLSRNCMTLEQLLKHPAGTPLYDLSPVEDLEELKVRHFGEAAGLYYGNVATVLRKRYGEVDAEVAHILETPHGLDMKVVVGMEDGTRRATAHECDEMIRQISLSRVV